MNQAKLQIKLNKLLPSNRSIAKQIMFLFKREIQKLSNLFEECLTNLQTMIQPSDYQIIQTIEEYKNKFDFSISRVQTKQCSEDGQTYEQILLPVNQQIKIKVSDILYSKNQGLKEMPLQNSFFKSTVFKTLNPNQLNHKKTKSKQNINSIIKQKKGVDIKTTKKTKIIPITKTTKRPQSQCKRRRSNSLKIK